MWDEWSQEQQNPGGRKRRGLAFFCHLERADGGGESQLTEDSPEAFVPPPSPFTVLRIKPKASGVLGRHSAHEAVPAAPQEEIRTETDHT